MGLGQSIAFLGAGNMCEAMVKGLVSAKTVPAKNISVSDPRPARLSVMSDTYNVRTFSENRKAVRGAGIVVLSVKPQILDEVLDEVGRDIAPKTLVISIAAGRRIDAIEERLPGGRRVIRAMPNVAAIVQAGATAVAKGAHATDDDVAAARRVFDAIGLTIVVDESLMDAVTGLSGSGPAYVFMMLEALADAGVKMGLSRWDAHALACQTMLGSAKLVIESKEHPGRLKDMVCSPGGTAIAAVHTLEMGGLRTTLMNAVEAATQRSRELGGGNGAATEPKK